MRKILKKVVTAVTTAALALTGIVTFNPVQAAADDYTVKLFIKLPSTVPASDVGVNTWGDSVTVSGNTGEVNKPASWGAGTLPGVTNESDGWASISLTTGGSISGVQFVDTNSGAINDNVWNSQIQAQKLTEAYYDASANKWFKEKACTNEIVKPTLDEIYYVAGSEGLIGANWAATNDLGKMTETSTGVFEVTYTRIPAGAYEFKILQDPVDFGWDHAKVDDDLKLANGNMGVTVSEETGISDVTIKYTAATGKVEVKVVKSAINGADVVEMIKKLPENITLDDEGTVKTVETAYNGLSDEQKALVTNYATLEAALKTIDELKKDAEDSANVIVHFNNSEDWSTVNAYTFVKEDDETSTVLSGEWPGKKIAANTANDGWYSFKLASTKDLYVIFNGDGKQTVDTLIPVNAEGKTEVWITLGDVATEPDGFGNYNLTTDVSTESPEGWTESDISDIPDDADNGDDPDDNDNKEDQTSAWNDAKLKIHVKMPSIDNWEKLGVYLFGTADTFGWAGGSGELAGAWPGAELKQEIGSKTWYAFGGTFTDGYYMAIINNFVSDDDVAQGAVKCQANDLELTDGEYWITIDADEEGNFVANVLTEAPEDYDGEGLADGQINDPDDNNDGDTTDDADDKDDASKDADKEDPASGSTDGLPVAAAMVLAMAGVTAVVVSRKRKVA